MFQAGKKILNWLESKALLPKWLKFKQPEEIFLQPSSEESPSQCFMEKQTQREMLSSCCSNLGIQRVNNNPLGQEELSFLGSQILHHRGQEYKKIIHLHISHQGLIKWDAEWHRLAERISRGEVRGGLRNL